MVAPEPPSADRKEIHMSSSTMPAARGTATLTDSQLTLLRALLEQQRNFRCDQLDQLEQPRRPESVNRRSATEREITESLIAGARAALSDVLRALRRMDEGRYGTCRDCDAPLAIERLEVLPQVSQCMSCQRETERS
jgi:DnaK suppressor protein